MSELIPTSLVPPGVRDERQKAFVQTLDAMLGQIDFSSLIMSDVQTVDARLLPVLVVEYSCQEFIEPGLEDGVVRDLLARSYDLHAMKGTVAGTRLGLSLLGMRVDWKQWYLTNPKGPHDTHVVTAFVNLKIFRDDPGFLSEKVQRQTLKMINATKRWSQDISFQLGAGWSGEFGVADAATALNISQKTIDAGLDTSRENRIGAANAASRLEIVARTVEAAADLVKANCLTTASAITSLQIIQQTFDDAA